MRGRNPVYQDPSDAENDRRELQPGNKSASATSTRTHKTSRSKRIQQTLTAMQSRMKKGRSTVPATGSSTNAGFETMGFGMGHVEREVTALTTAGLESPTKTRTRLADKLEQAGSSLIPLFLNPSKPPAASAILPTAPPATPTTPATAILITDAPDEAPSVQTAPTAVTSTSVAPPVATAPPVPYRMIDAISLDQISTWHF